MPTIIRSSFSDGEVDSLPVSLILTKEQKEWIQSLPDEMIWFHSSTPMEYAVIMIDWWFCDMPEETVFWRPPTDKEYKAAVKRLKTLATQTKNR